MKTEGQVGGVAMTAYCAYAVPLTAVTVAVLFLACLFIAPLAGAVPAYATAPALLYVSCLMLRELVEIDWSDVTEEVPAVLTALGRLPARERDAALRN